MKVEDHHHLPIPTGARPAGFSDTQWEAPCALATEQTIIFLFRNSFPIPDLSTEIPNAVVLDDLAHAGCRFHLFDHGLS